MSLLTLIYKQIHGECDCRMLATILSGLHDVATALLGHAKKEDLTRFNTLFSVTEPSVWRMLDIVNPAGGCQGRTTQGFRATYGRLLFEGFHHTDYIAELLPEDERLPYLVGDFTFS